MRFQQFFPPDYLQEYVRYFWVLESASDCVEMRTFRMIADGYPGFILQQAEQQLFRDQTQKQWPRAFLYGQTTTAGDISVPGPFRTLGVYFHPSALPAIFGFNADELTNSCVGLDLLAPSLAERLINTQSVPKQIELLSNYLFEMAQKSKAAMSKDIQYSLRQIDKSSGGICLRDLHQTLGVTERSFQRKFKQCVGIPPKLFSRICRFQVSLNQLRNHQYRKLSDVAFENDYGDQSHYIRSFQEFAGCSPFQYQKQVNELVENFPLLVQ
ncbi:DUF6597 domain-containing transcriptional factor [uncultured Hymenobacter sp.]|uniref:DUF6597 domain-containing transcriptional factor n=1 Tax=uncultured Hymenobacter sp. TaxID=170016 RepID=UPI0035CBA98D